MTVVFELIFRNATGGGRGFGNMTTGLLRTARSLRAKLLPKIKIMHLSNIAGNRKVSDRPKLVYVAALSLVAYVVLTTVWFEWGNLEGAQIFSMVKHLVVVLLLVASLFFYLRAGCWATLAWCAFVPLARYGALFREFSSVVTGGGLGGSGYCSNPSAIHCVPALGSIGARLNVERMLSRVSTGGFGAEAVKTNCRRVEAP
ncbi:hypothetical protein [Burkholderia ambifaria]|uniref:hypothetical protein n=1 Tax=Burkholderia ambifaria TaxID=152480 RepID=UPI00158B097A|nr:hypothetical protein [Burkholderia ambifaria]